MFGLTPYRRNLIQQPVLGIERLFEDFFSDSFLLKLEFEDGRLSIMVEHNEELKADKDNYLHRERRSYSTSRTFAFDNVDQEQISAKYENGVLSVTLPKPERLIERFRRSRIIL